MKRILAVHDLSCHGAASLGIAIPVLTAFGHKVVALPSVILSSTTDIDQDPVILETTEWMYKVVERWEKQRMVFDAVYTGWLGDPRQIDLIVKLCEGSGHNKVAIFIDPVLGDCGALYPCRVELAKAMNRLVAKAQIITPIGGSGDLFASLLVGRWLKEELLRSRHDKMVVIKSVVKTISDMMKMVQDNQTKDLPFRELLSIS